MSTQGEVITKDRIGFEKSNKALGYIYKEWYEIISNFISEEEGINMAYVYGVGKFPIAPFMRGIVRAGYSIPLDEDDMYEPGLAYGVGARFKLPLIPIGLEALYTIHSLEMKPSGEDFADALIDVLDFKLNALNITATLKF